MKLKPGKYVQRDGGIATVAAVDETRGENAAVGWNKNGEPTCWCSDGAWAADEIKDGCDLIREHREPREWWIYKAAQHDRDLMNESGEIIHVREVIE